MADLRLNYLLTSRNIDLTVAEDEACTNAKYSTLGGERDDLGGILNGPSALNSWSSSS